MVGTWLTSISIATSVRSTAVTYSALIKVGTKCVAQNSWGLTLASSSARVNTVELFTNSWGSPYSLVRIDISRAKFSNGSVEVVVLLSCWSSSMFGEILQLLAPGRRRFHLVKSRKTFSVTLCSQSMLRFAFAKNNSLTKSAFLGFRCTGSALP